MEIKSIGISANNFVHANNQFAIKSFNTLVEGQGENILYSSFGLYTSLFPLYYGAAGETKKELGELLNISEIKNDSVMLSGYNSILNDLENVNNDKYKITIGNSLWYQEDYGLKTEFINKYTDKLHLEFNTADFQINLTMATQKINTWVSDKTGGRIQKIISNDDITRTTRSVLTNTIIFDAEWAYTFDRSQTQKGVFYNFYNSIDSVYFMNQVEHLNYYENKDFKILELPYAYLDFSLIIVLPVKFKKFIENNPAISEEIFEILKASHSYLKLYKVKVSIPKFNVENSFSCEELLKKMNFKQIFSTECNLSYLFPDEKIFVNSIFQKNLFEVNEERSIFASSTMTMMSAASISEKKENIKEFTADHPFLLILISKKYNLIISIGQILTINY